MSTQRLSRLDIERFAYGEEDALEEVILADPEYLAELEAIWAEELPSDLRAPVLRLLQWEQFVSGVLGVTIDLATELPDVIIHYLTAGEEDG